MTARVSVNLHRRLTVLQRLTWEAMGAEPGSPVAILCDELALLALSSLEEPR